MNQSWKIKKRAKCCQHCGTDFTEGETFYTSLSETIEEEGFLREDYKEGCWNEVEEGLNAFSSWKSTFEILEEEKEQPETVDRRDAESLLRTMIEEDKAETDNARFILAVMLERQKTLIETDVKETDEGAKIRFYEQKGTGDIFIVRDPNLPLEEVERVQQEVSDLLEG